MRIASFDDDALDQLGEWFLHDRKTGMRIMRMIKECQRSPFEGIGKPEPLKGNKSGLWSRRIDDEHRMVYRVTDEHLIILSLYGHY